MKKKKKKINFDNLTLDEMDKMIIEKPSKKKNIIQEKEIEFPENPKCQFCDGELFVVQPIIEFEGRKLLECMNCHERIYLYIDILQFTK